MRTRPIFAACALFAVLLLAMPLYAAHAQNYVQYKVEINVDGSALWTITQASDSSGSIDTWQGFQQRVANLISASSIQTQREMSLDNDSLQMNTIWETQSHTTEYQFSWLNFSTAQNGTITFGEAFQVSGFFSMLYGDGEIQFFYPSTYHVQSATPQPNGGDTDPQTLDWLGTVFFVKGNPRIVLTEISAIPSATPNQDSNVPNWQPYAIIGLVLAVAAAASAGGFFAFKRRKGKSGNPTNPIPRIDLPAVQSEEEKILKVIQAKGGSAFQSAITEQCRFSKAKTSQLLTALEKKGVVTRYKKGRDKIVTLNQQGKGGTP